MNKAWMLMMSLASAMAPVAAAEPAAAGVAGAAPCCAVVELRRYITYPGRRDTLIDMFERTFIAPQEAVGIRVMGQFRDLNDPLRFTWVRGFGSMDERRQGLAAFYDGPLWKAWRARANATLYDNDDVLLLRPAGAHGAFGAQAPWPQGEAAPGPDSLVVVTLYHFAQDPGADFLARFDAELAPLFARHGARLLGRFVSEHSANTFPRLPVREDAHVFAWFAHFADRAAYDRYQHQLGDEAQWRERLFAPLYRSLARAPETLLLQPTAASLLR